MFCVVSDDMHNTTRVASRHGKQIAELVFSKIQLSVLTFASSNVTSYPTAGFFLACSVRSLF
jgi:hypothetical protein